jgi:hypothetical protein
MNQTFGPDRTDPSNTIFMPRNAVLPTDRRRPPASGCHAGPRRWRIRGLIHRVRRALPSCSRRHLSLRAHAWLLLSEQLPAASVWAAGSPSLCMETRSAQRPRPTASACPPGTSGPEQPAGLETRLSPPASRATPSARTSSSRSARTPCFSSGASTRTPRRGAVQGPAFHSARGLWAKIG